jgi:hypothetical protein
MWQPNRAQWSLIWTVTGLILIAWPSGNGRSLAVTTLRWAVDPSGSLPRLPAPLPMALDDDGDAVAAHDAVERDYYRAYDASRITRWRMKLRGAEEPLDPAIERQLLGGIAVLSALAVWRLSGPRATRPSS